MLTLEDFFLYMSAAMILGILIVMARQVTRHDVVPTFAESRMFEPIDPMRHDDLRATLAMLGLRMQFAQDERMNLNNHMRLIVSVEGGYYCHLPWNPQNYDDARMIIFVGYQEIQKQENQQ